MKLDDMKNIVIIKNLPSNLIEEAIVVIKDKSKAKNIEKFVEKKEKTKNKTIVQGFMKEEDFKRIKNIQTENRKYIIKEAEMVVNDYLERINENKKYYEKIKLTKTYKKMKYANFFLMCTSIISTLICILT